MIKKIVSVLSIFIGVDGSSVLAANYVTDPGGLTYDIFFALGTILPFAIIAGIIYLIYRIIRRKH
jgi:hypothetical protein